MAANNDDPVYPSGLDSSSEPDCWVPDSGSAPGETDTVLTAADVNSSHAETLPPQWSDDCQAVALTTVATEADDKDEDTGDTGEHRGDGTPADNTHDSLSTQTAGHETQADNHLTQSDLRTVQPDFALTPPLVSPVPAAHDPALLEPLGINSTDVSNAVVLQEGGISLSNEFNEIQTHTTGSSQTGSATGTPAAVTASSPKSLSDCESQSNIEPCDTSEQDRGTNVPSSADSHLIVNVSPGLPGQTAYEGSDSMPPPVSMVTTGQAAAVGVEIQVAGDVSVVKTEPEEDEAGLVAMDTDLDETLEESHAGSQCVNAEDLPQLKVTLLDISTLPEIQKLWNTSINENNLATGVERMSSLHSVTVPLASLPDSTSESMKSKAAEQRQKSAKSSTKKATVSRIKGKPSQKATQESQMPVSTGNMPKNKCQKGKTKNTLSQQLKAKKGTKVKNVSLNGDGKIPKASIKRGRQQPHDGVSDNTESVQEEESVEEFEDNWMSESEENLEDSDDEYTPTSNEYQRRKQDKLKAIFSKIKTTTEKSPRQTGRVSMSHYIERRTKPVLDRKGGKRIGRPPVIGTFHCKSCNFEANEKNLVLKHHAQVHMLHLMQCHFCEFTSRSRHVMMEHEARQHTNDKPFKCSHKGCDYASKCKTDLDRHQSKHATVKQFKCPHCDFTTKWRRNIRHHVLKHTTLRPYECEICGFAFKRIQDLKYHLFRHNDDKPIKCDKCDFRCKTNFEIRCHMLKHSDKRYFECPHPGCTQSTKTKSDLTKHMRIHSNKRDQKCPICNKGFKTKASVQKHQSRVHSEDKPFECHICQKKFKVKPALRNHIRLHEGIKPFKCEVCNRDFANKSNMQMHMKTHSLEGRPFHCPICPYGARTISHLLTHIGSMHGDSYAYFCELCKKPFKRYGQLQIHYKRMHSKSDLDQLGSAADVDLALLKMEMKLDLESIANEEPKRKRGRPRKQPLPPETPVIKVEPVDVDEEVGVSQLGGTDTVSAGNSGAEGEALSSGVTSCGEPEGSAPVTSQAEGEQRAPTVIMTESLLPQDQVTRATVSNMDDRADDQCSADPTASSTDPMCGQSIPMSIDTGNEKGSIQGDKGEQIPELPIAITENDQDTESALGHSTAKLDKSDSQPPEPETACQKMEVQNAAATLAMYDGFRLPLATKGFEFNFEKTGKKPNCWFMSPKNMHGKAAKKQEAYLRKKGWNDWQSQKKRLYAPQTKVRKVQILSKTDMADFLKKRRKKLKLPQREKLKRDLSGNITEAMVCLSEEYKNFNEAKTVVTGIKKGRKKIEFETLAGHKLSKKQVGKILPKVGKSGVANSGRNKQQASKSNKASKKSPSPKKSKPEVSPKSPSAGKGKVTASKTKEESTVTETPKRKYVKKAKPVLLSAEKMKGKKIEIRKPLYLQKKNGNSLKTNMQNEMLQLPKGGHNSVMDLDEDDISLSQLARTGSKSSGTSATKPGNATAGHKGRKSSKASGATDNKKVKGVEKRKYVRKNKDLASKAKEQKEVSSEGVKWKYKPKHAGKRAQKNTSEKGQEKLNTDTFGENTEVQSLSGKRKNTKQVKVTEEPVKKKKISSKEAVSSRQQQKPNQAKDAEKRKTAKKKPAQKHKVTKTGKLKIKISKGSKSNDTAHVSSQQETNGYIQAENGQCVMVNSSTSQENNGITVSGQSTSQLLPAPEQTIFQPWLAPGGHVVFQVAAGCEDQTLMSSPSKADSQVSNILTGGIKCEATFIDSLNQLDGVFFNQSSPEPRAGNIETVTPVMLTPNTGVGVGGVSFTTSSPVDQSPDNRAAVYPARLTRNSQDTPLDLSCSSNGSANTTLLTVSEESGSNVVITLATSDTTVEDNPDDRDTRQESAVVVKQEPSCEPDYFTSIVANGNQD